MNDCLEAMQWRQLLEEGIMNGSIAVHLASCGVCSERYAQLEQVESRLREIGAIARAELAPGCDRLENARERLMKQLAWSEPGLSSIAGGALTMGRLLLLEQLVRPACGAQMATLAIVQAARKTRGWNSFLVCLAEIMSVMCGETLRRMVVECGQQIP